MLSVLITFWMPTMELPVNLEGMQILTTILFAKTVEACVSLGHG